MLLPRVRLSPVIYTPSKMANPAGVLCTETQSTNECHIGGWLAVFGQRAYGIARQTAPEFLKVWRTQRAKENALIGFRGLRLQRGPRSAMPF
jgi:hypothetical protein